MRRLLAVGPSLRAAMAVFVIGTAQAVAASEPAPPNAVASDRPALPATETPCFHIRQIGLRGEEAPRFAWLLDRLAGADGADGPLRRCIGAAGIGVVVQRAQQALIERGFVTTRVLVEPQDLQHGELTLTVLPGRLRQLRFTDPAADHPTALTAFPLRAGDVLNLRDIEQALENFKRVPTVSADIQIVPGDEPGHSDLVISWMQRQPARVSLSLDDSGSGHTGRHHAGAVLHLDNPLGLNDLLHAGVQGPVGRRAAGQQVGLGHTVHYSVPWGRVLLSLDLLRHRSEQTVAGLSQDYTYRGGSASQEVTLSWLVHRDALSKTTLHARAFAAQSRQTIDDTEVMVQRRRVGGWQLGAGHRTFIGAGSLELSMTYQRGTGAFGALPAPEDAFGEGTSRFALVKAGAEVRWPFKLGHQPWELHSRWRAQVHRTALSPPERFAIGGRHTVRGFDGEVGLSAESGWTWRNDLSTPLGGSGASVFAGLDHGRVRGPSDPLLLGTRLTGAVVGLRRCPCDPGVLQFELFAGWPLHKPEGFPAKRTSLGFSLAAAF